MGEYIVSARKYRPMSFDSVVGQTALTTTLKNSVKSGKLAHAYLFCGPRGVGKTTCARIFAKAINCEHPRPDGEACNECESCKAFNEGRSYNIFELDAASNSGVEDIKTLMEQTRIPPQVGKYKVFIIDEVHMLSQQAFNAFLKTLEEPPAYVVFILATTEKHKILPTILSRCQIYDFERMTVSNIIAQLEMVAGREGISYEKEALEVIAEKADGGMRDALSIFDQAASFCQGNITYQKVIDDLNVLDSDNYFRLTELAFNNKVAEMMVLLNSILEKGFDGGNLIDGMAEHVRNVMMARDTQTIPLLECSEAQKRKYQEQAKTCPANFLYKALRLLNRCSLNYKQSSNKRLLVELTLIEVAQITQANDDEPAAGRSPRSLKSLFKHKAAQPQPASQGAGAGARPQGVLHTGNAHTATTVAHSAPSSLPASDATPAPSPVEASPAKPKTTSIKLGSVGMTFGRILKEEKKDQHEEDEDNATPLHSTSETPTGNVPQANETNNQPFTQDQLGLQWMVMCKRMPQSMVGISSRMINMVPQITQMPNIELVVDNKFLQDQLEGIRKRIRATLRKLLGNDALEMTIRLAEKSEVHTVLTRRETFEKICKENPAVEKLRQTLDLELA